MARTPTEAVGSYLSTEHHMDMYALGMILVNNKKVTSKYLSTEEQSMATDAQAISETFIAFMWDEERNMFNAGTANTIGDGFTGPDFAVDCQTWLVLCGALQNRHQHCL